MEVSIIVAIGLGLCAINYLSEHIAKLLDTHHYAMMSFSGGTMIAILFLMLIPEAIHLAGSEQTFFWLVVGFSLFHLTEKYLFQHTRHKKHMMHELKMLHTAGLFVDHAVIGFAMTVILGLESSISIVILLPMILHIALSSLSMEHIQAEFESSRPHIVLPLAPLFGVIAGLFLPISEGIIGNTLGFMIGMLLYIVCRDILPKKSKGYPIIFGIGVLLIMVIWRQLGMVS